MPATQSFNVWHTIWKPALAVAAAVVLLLGVLAVAAIWRGLGQVGPVLVYYTATKGDLPIVITERGNLQSQRETTIRNQVESVSNFDTTIIHIVPNGAQVEEGQLLVELDSAPIREELDADTLEWQAEKSELLQAEARATSQITQNETRFAQAELAVQLAELQLEMYRDPQSGTFQMQRENIARLVDDTRNTILETQAALELERTQKAGIEALFKLGYKGKSEFDQSKYSFQRAEFSLSAAMNQLRNHAAALKQLNEYVKPMELLRLEGELATARRNLEQVKVTNDSELAQAEAQVWEAREGESRERGRLEERKRQVELCKIYSPHAGLAVYAQDNFGGGGRYGSMSEIGLGAAVRERQALLTIPDLARMEVRTHIHEAVLEQVKTGLPVTVRVDAVPHRTYDGIVTEVAVVPAANSNSNVKTYDCTIKIIEEVEQLRPGMTAVCQIHVDRLRDVVSVPVQAIVEDGKDAACYVDRGTGVERRSVELGRSNDAFVHLRSGVEPGERVVLNPMSLLDVEQDNENTISPASGAPEAPIEPDRAVRNATTEED